jgi:CDP-diacylglycerol---glycerol-3-phosphate 3-phosphatidyltransferase
VNLPNAITVARIFAAPVTAALILMPVWQLRFVAWLLYLAAAITDYYDGKLARSRGLVTDLGRLLDPIADKLLLACTLVPMWWLMRGVPLFSPLPPSSGWADGSTVGHVLADGHLALPFVTPFGLVGLPAWIILVVLGRELLMTVFRQVAARRGVIISAIGPAKWKTGFQSTWAGAAFFWFGAAAAAAHYQWTSGAWRALAMFNGIVGTLSMIGAVALTIYSLGLYIQRYGSVLSGAGRAKSRGPA